MTFKFFPVPAFVAALSFTAPALAEPPQVVTDIAPVHSLTAQVMGDLGTPALLVSANDTPHSFSMRPSQADNLEKAGLVIWIGEALTPWLEDPLETLAPGATRVELMDVPGTRLLEFREGLLFDGDGHEDGHQHDHDAEHDEAHHEEHDHADDHGDAQAESHDHGHGHGHEHDHGSGMDPHAWLDPRNASVWLSAIAETLADLDPANAETYRANAAAAQAGLVQVEAELVDKLAAAQGQRFIPFHDAYHYFEDRFGLTTVGALALSDAQPPSPKRLQTLRETLANVDCVFTEPQFSAGLVDTLIEGTQTGVATLDPLGATLEPGPALYTDLLRGIADQISGCAEG